MRTHQILYGMGGVAAAQLLGFLAAQFGEMRVGALLLVGALCFVLVSAGLMKAYVGGSGYGYGFGAQQLFAGAPYFLLAIAVLVVVFLGAWASFGG